MSQANLEAAFALANKWREASGQEIMSAWFPAIPQESNACLLARAFNKNCFVTYNTTIEGDPAKGVGSFCEDDHDKPYQMQSGSGLVDFTSIEDAEEFAGITGYERDYTVVYIPDEIALVAWEFDNGAYAEYAEKGNY